MKRCSWFIYIYFSLNLLSATQANSWTAEPFFIVSKGISLKRLLADVGTYFGRTIQLSPRLDQAVFVGKLSEETPEAFLDKLGKLHQFSWYEDGQTIYIYAAEEVSQKLVTLRYLSVQELLLAAQKISVVNERSCRIRSIEEFNSCEISGVPACVERFSKLAQDLESMAEKKTLSAESVRVFPLKYADAADVEYQYRDQNVRVPGVVSVLKEMYQNQTGSLSLPGRSGIVTSPTDQTYSPQFSADTRLNAVVIRDRDVTMPLYEKLVNSLDVKPIQIEISVAIIDVDERDMQSLGVEWNVSTSLGPIRASYSSEAAAATGSVAVINNTQAFLAKLYALQSRAKAKVLSQPSVVTLNNVQAILDKNITFYTKLQSEKNSSLESVTTGTLLRATPRLIADPEGKEEVFLQINLEDGRQQASAEWDAEGLPQVQSSTLTTQATLHVGQSLLLGGFVQERESEVVNKVPWLGEIPVVGYLFKKEQVQVHSVVRLFLIKATPVKLAGPVKIAERDALRG